MEESSCPEQHQPEVGKWKASTTSPTILPPHPILLPQFFHSNGLPQPHQQQQSPPDMADPLAMELQRAYAEIMLNMAKESARRVMVEEQRAVILAREIASAKEEGVAMLIRLKVIMEAKIKEAESNNLAHVKKIDVLQEQVQDAQNTVASLQVELQKANTELEQTRKTLAEERKKILPTGDQVDSNKNRGSPKMHLQSMPLKNKITPDNTGDVPTKTDENGIGFDLSSSRNRKSKLYRKGYTHHLRAIKQLSRSADYSLEQNSKQACALSSCSKIGKKGTARMPGHTGSVMEQILETNFFANYKGKRGKRSRPSYMHDTSGEHVNTEDKSSDTSAKNGCLLLLQAMERDLSRPNMFTGHIVQGLTDLKDDLAIGGKDANISTAPTGLEHEVSYMQMTRRKRSKTVRVFEHGCCDPKSVPISGNTLLRSNIENTGCSDTPPINNASVLSNGPANLMHPSEATEILMNPTDASVLSNGTADLMHPAEATEIFMNPTSQLTSGNSSPPALLSTKSQIGGESELQVEHPESITPENHLAGLKDVKVGEHCNLALDRVYPLILTPLDKEHNSNASSRFSMQATGARCIKYTFNRRKRKNVSLDTPPQVAVPDKSSSLVSPADKQEPQAQDLFVESSEDEELINAAHQLILLSQKKW